MTYKEIKEYSKEKSNSLIQGAIVKFQADGLIKKKGVGNILLYQIDFGNSTVFSYFDILIKEILSSPVRDTLRVIREELSDTEFVSIIIFGSYAEGKQTEKSDLDVGVFVNSSEEKRKCELSLKSANLKTVLNIDYHVFTKNEMLQMLKDKQENLGKQMAHKHLAVYNPEIFYSIIQEGIDNGFKIVYS
ncbi:MAG: nucleotidyltransferase domain-containing protein [Candidatus Woesearchaeota archaeon]